MAAVNWCQPGKVAGAGYNFCNSNNEGGELKVLRLHSLWDSQFYLAVVAASVFVMAAAGVSFRLSLVFTIGVTSIASAPR